MGKKKDIGKEGGSGGGGEEEEWGKRLERGGIEKKDWKEGKRMKWRRVIEKGREWVKVRGERVGESEGGESG